ncbi:MAG: hypothetical protein ACKVYV_07260 [Limisphaerales bacterium]
MNVPLPLRLLLVGVLYWSATSRAEDSGVVPVNGGALEVRGEPDRELAVVQERVIDLPDAGAGRRAVLPEDVKRLLSEFQKAREAFDQKRAELVQQTKGATDADRAKFREQFQELRRQFIEQQKMLREEVRRRIEELKRELPLRQELIDAAKEKARERRGRDGE